MREKSARSGVSSRKPLPLISIWRFPSCTTVPMPVGVRTPPKAIAIRANSFSKRTLRNEFNGKVTRKHLSLSFRVKADMAHDSRTNELSADELADANARFCGIVGDDDKIPFFLTDELINNAFWCPNAHKAADHQRGTVWDFIYGIGQR